MITIHEAKAADFTTLGLGALLPSECTVRERAGGMYELKIVHPVTEDGRHHRIKPMRIIKAPAPVRETPLVEIGQTGTIYRDIYKVVTDGRRLYLRVKPDQESKGLRAYKPGTEVVSMELSNDGKWRRVAILDGGATGWMWAGNLQFVRTETETIVGDTPGTIVQPRQTREQLFRVYFYSPDTKTRTITAEARHITYDLVGAVVDGEYSPENVPANQVCAQIMARADHDVSDFHIYCTITDPISGEYGGRNILDCLLDPETGIVAQTKARIVRDNYDIFILPDEVRSRGVELRYGKNLLSAYMDTDTSNTITRIKPVGKTKDGEPLLIEENGGWVESPHIDDYPVVYSKEVEYDVVESDELPIEQARALLKEKAKTDFEAGCDAATVRLDADFVRLELTDDYRHLANQYALHLYDSVPVIDREAGIVATARMTEYVYDAILDEYQDTGLGELDDVKSTIYGYELAAGSVSGGKLMPNTVNGDRLQNSSVSYGKFDLAAIKHLSADAIVAIRAEIRELVAGNITTDELYANLAKIAVASIEKADINWAEIDSLYAEIAKIVKAEIEDLEVGWAGIYEADIEWAKIENLTAEIAKIATAEIGKATINWAQIVDVKIKTADIEEAAIGTAQIALGAITQALIQAGAIGEAQIADGSITAAKIVSLNADVIKAGTLSVDRLLLKGDNGLFYAINATAGGLTSTQLTQEQYKNAISGTALVARSVTADKIAAKSITSNEILSGTITAAEINVANLFAADATISALNNYILRTQTIEAIEGQLDVWASNKISLAVGGIKQVSNVEVQYYKSTSATTQTGGSWQATAPEWQNGTYIWTKTVTTYTDNSTSTVGPINVTGQRGEDGDVGAAGRGVSSMHEQYYLSNSSTIPPDEEDEKWQTTQPELSAGQYIWTRIKITYTDDEIGYTDPVCDVLRTTTEARVTVAEGNIEANAKSIKDAADAAGNAVTTANAASLKVDGLEGAVTLQASRTVGGMNCLRGSDKGLSSDKAYLGLFEFVGDLKPRAGEKVSVRIWGRLGDGRTGFTIYNTNDYIPIGTLEANEDGTYSGTFNWKLESATKPEYNLTEDSQTHIAVYAFPRDATSTSTIDRIALVIGSSMPEWSLPAAETSSSLRVQADRITMAVNSPAVGVKTGEDSAVRVTITSEEFSVDVPGEDGDFRLNETGGYLPVLAADYVNAPNVAPMYDGPEILHVNPNASGDEVAAGTHYRSLSSACSRVSNKWLGHTVTIQLAPGMVESGGVTLSGVSGGKWLSIIGDSNDRAKLTARLDIKFCTAPISVNYLNIEPGKANIGIHAEGCNAVTVASCDINGGGIPTKDDGSACIKASRGTDMNISGCNLTNCYRSIISHSGSTVTATDNEGNCNVIAAWAMCYLTGKVPTNKTTWGSGAYTEYAGQVLSADLALPESVVTPELPPDPPTATDFVYTHSDSYRGSWSSFGDDDIRQGWDGSTIYGVIWFDVSDMQSKLNGKEVRQASLKLYMAKGVGREATVSVQLYGTDKEYEGHSGRPNISDWSYGDIGSAEPGMINEFSIPPKAIEDIVNGETQALVLKSNDTTKYESNSYSRNYAKFAGSSTATDATKPRLTVVYQ